MDSPFGKDSMVDSTQGRSLPISAGMAVLFQMGGYERLRKNISTVPDLADEAAQRELNAVRGELYDEREDAFKYYPAILERMDALQQAHGRTLKLDIDRLVVLAILEEPMEALARRSEALIEDLSSRAESGDTEGFAPTVAPLTPEHFRRHTGIAHNNAAHFWRKAGAIERAVWHQEQSVKILNETDGLGVIPVIDRRYSLAGMLMEYAQAIYDQARQLDEEFVRTKDNQTLRLDSSSLEYPELTKLAKAYRVSPMERA